MLCHSFNWTELRMFALDMNTMSRRYRPQRCVKKRTLAWWIVSSRLVHLSGQNSADMADQEMLQRMTLATEAAVQAAQQALQMVRQSSARAENGPSSGTGESSDQWSKPPPFEPKNRDEEASLVAG